MKKVVTILICVFLLAGCGTTAAFGENITCKDIMRAAVDATEAPEYDNIYSISDNSFNSTAMSLWAYGIYDECAEYNLIADCAIYVASGNSSYEVGVIKPEKTEDIEKIESIFASRKEAMSAGNKAAYDPNFSSFLKNSEIYTDGDFVIFLMTEDNTAAKTAINNLKTAK